MLPITYNTRSLMVRKVGTIVTMLGVAMTVGVFVALMALAYGLQRTLVSTGSSQNVLVLRSGALAEANSAISREQFSILKYLDDVQRDAGNQSLASAELCLQLYLDRGDRTGANVLIRGVEQVAFAVHNQFKIVQGRTFRPQASECVIGLGAATRYKRTAAIGKKIRFGQREWEIVGVFEAGGSAFESEIWTDARDLMGDYKRLNFSSVTFKLADPAAFQRVKQLVADDPRLGLRARTELEYYEDQSAGTMQIKGLAMAITLLMSVGAMFALMNTMYAAIAGRTREIAAMRAVGFPQGQILLSFMAESVLLTVTGGLVGCLLALPFQGLTSGTMNARSFSEVSFSLTITPGIFLMGLAFSLLMGLAGGFFPAWQASRMPIIKALREG